MALADPVRRRHPLEPVALHPSLEAFPLADPRHVDVLSRNEVARVDPRPRLEEGVRRGDAELAHDVGRVFLRAVGRTILAAKCGQK